MIDMRPIMREFVAEALEGAIIQAEWCQRFLNNGNDSQAEAAFRRMMEFIRRGSAELQAIKVHTQHSRVCQNGEPFGRSALDDETPAESRQIGNSTSVEASA